MLNKVSNTKERLIEYMNINNIKQADLAKRTGLNRSVISLYVSGKREPMQDNITTLAEKLNVSPAWLMGLDVPMVAKKEPTHEELVNDYMDSYKTKDDINQFLNDKRAIEIIKCFNKLDEKQRDYILLTLKVQMSLIPELQ